MAYLYLNFVDNLDKGLLGCNFYLDRKKKRCIIYTMGFVYPFDVFKL